MRWPVDKAFGIVPLWITQAKISDRAVRLYALLSGERDFGTDMASLGRKRLAKDLRCSTDSLDRAKSELEKIGAISVVRDQGPNGALGINTYKVHRDQPGSRTGAAMPVAAQERLSGTGADSIPPIDEKNSTPSELRVRIEQTWLSSEGMIAHRESYFADQKVRRAIDKAVKKYGVDDVCAAITSYATVLASPDHLWSHRWTLLDFLKRGLDRFVPEAQPEEVFRLNGRRSGDNGGDDGLDYLNS